MTFVYFFHRKEEKMKEIQLQREQEEQSRQAALQLKREQAEIATLERQKYEMKRKEHSTKATFNDAAFGGNSAHRRKPTNLRGTDKISGGNVGYGRIEVDDHVVDGIASGGGIYGRSNIKRTMSSENAFEVHGPAHSTAASAFSGFSGTQTNLRC